MLEKVKKNQKGFTLIELLVVIAILGILATLYVPRIISNSSDAKKQVAIANARTLASEITMNNFRAGNSEDGYLAIDPTTGTSYLAEATITGSSNENIKALLSGREFPNTNYVRIDIDATGNAIVYVPNSSGTTWDDAVSGS